VTERKRSLSRVRGLVTLLRDGVVHGSRAIEDVTRRTADRTYDILEAIPVIAAPAKVVHVVHDLATTTTFTTIRAVTELSAAVVDAGLAAAEEVSAEEVSAETATPTEASLAELAPTETTSRSAPEGAP
jgi:predicted nucleotidyltransferase